MDIYVIAVAAFLSYPFWRLLETGRAWICHWHENRKWRQYHRKRLDRRWHIEQEASEEMSEDIEFPQQYAIKYAEQFKLVDTNQLEAIKSTAHLPFHGIRLEAISRKLDA